MSKTSEQLVVAALDAMQDLFYAFDSAGTITAYNQQLIDVTGYSAAEVESMQPWEFFLEESQERVAQKVAQTLEEEHQVTLEAELLTASGDRIPYEFTGAPYYTEQGEVEGLVGIGRDITARREHEQERERTEEFLRQTQKVANLGYWEVDFRTDSLRWTDQTFHIHDLPLNGAPSLEEAFEFFHPEDRPTIVSAFNKLRTDHEPFDLEVRIISADEETKWVRARGEPWQADNEVVGARGTFQDINDRMQDRLQLQQQRDDLHTLNQMLSHDIRNNLQVVTARADIVTDQVTDSEQAHVETILRNAESAVELIESAQTLAEAMLNQGNERQPIALSTVLNPVIDEVRSTSPTASVTVDGTIPDIAVQADQMLPAVFRNLLKNAVQHNDNDNPEVSIDALVHNDEISVRIADNGPGIPPDQREEIFGKSDKRPGADASGIGLYLVKTIVTNCNGDIRVEDNDPRGSVFVVDLPVAK